MGLSFCKLSKDVSTQTNSDILNSAILRKLEKNKSEELVKNSKTTFDVFPEELQQSKGSCQNEKKDKNCNYFKIRAIKDDDVKYESSKDQSDINLFAITE